jgi:hypothetical protein
VGTREFIRVAAACFPSTGPVLAVTGVDRAGGAIVDVLRQGFAGRSLVTCHLGADALDERVLLSQLAARTHAPPTIVCADGFEELPEPRELLEDLIGAMSPGACLLLIAPIIYVSRSSAAVRPLSPLAVERLFAPLELAIVGWQGEPDFPHTVFGLGWKRPVAGEVLRGAHRFMADFEQAATATNAENWWAKLRGEIRTRVLRRPRQRLGTNQIQFAMHLPSGQSWQASLLDLAPPAPTQLGSRIDLA